MQMLYDKRTILAILSQEGDGVRVDEAAVELPEMVDSERHAELLKRLGLDPERLQQQVEHTDHGEAGAQLKPPGFEAGPG